MDIDDHIKEYNNRTKKGHNLKDPAHFSKYFPKFKAEIASQKEWNRKIKLDSFRVS